ncbi:MAG: alkaline phosphatase family protein [Myxococcota bacterium]
MRRLIAVALLLLLTSCGSAPPVIDPVQEAADIPPEPRLVVLIVLDQLASWVFARYLPHLPEDGLLRRIAEEGAVHHVDYPYAATATAAGHASIITGRAPYEHGVMANTYWNGTAEVASVDDGEHGVLGADGKHVSPTVLRTPAVTDLLHERTEGAAEIVSLSYKDRGAALTGGRHADLVLFYVPNVEGFTTSSYYGDSLPSWFSSWNDANPVRDRITPWQVGDTSWFPPFLGEDAQEGEGGYHGLDNTFPHDPGETERPFHVFRTTPHATDYLIDLARQAVSERNMGADSVLDFLSISVSGTDYVGHFFGPMSWEYADNLRRTDLQLAAFVRELEARGPVSVIVTSDHGVAALPERARNEGIPAGRLFRRTVIDAAEAAAVEILGRGEWVEAFAPPFLYLTPAAEERRDEVVLPIAQALTELEQVHGAYDVAQAATLRGSPDPIEVAAGLSIHESAPGQLFVVPAEHQVPELTDLPGTGTSHGTPWSYDRRVPCLLLGPNIHGTVTMEVGDQRRVGSTIAALLGLPPPDPAYPALPF